jgi:hypothetical protein
MTEMVTSSSMSGEWNRSDGLLGESGNERRRSSLAPPALYATAPLFDSTVRPLDDYFGGYATRYEYAAAISGSVK